MKLLTPASRGSYRRRILLDLLVLLTAGALLWGGAGFPLPRAIAFRAMERQRLLEPSEVVLETTLPSGTEVTVGVTDTHIHAAATGLDRFCRWERTGEPQLILLPAESRETITLAAVDVPEGTASARLELTLCFLQNWTWDPTGISGRYDLTGTAAGELFLFTPQAQYSDEDSERNLSERMWLEYGYCSIAYQDLPPYVLTCYNADGQVLAVCENP